jgi:glycosyltransferase involved in cell wall biosynthesis
LAAYLCCKVVRVCPERAKRVEGLPGCKVKYIIHNHSSDLHQLVKVPFIGKWLARKIIYSAAKFCCVNTQLKQEALSLFTKEEQKKLISKIIVLPMGVSLSPNYSLLTTNYYYDFSFLGRLTAKKGLSYFLAAVAQVKRPLRIAIAGQGEQEKEIRDKITEIRNRRSDIRDKIEIEMLGQITGAGKIDFINKSRFFVFPALTVDSDIEGLPVAMLEVMLSGKKVLASRATNIELLPEWPLIREEHYLLPHPQNIAQFATILRQMIELKSEPKAKITAKVLSPYLWDNLINRYHQELVL